MYALCLLLHIYGVFLLVPNTLSVFNFNFNGLPDFHQVVSPYFMT